LNCVICKKEGEGHHILTRKAYPGLIDAKFNIIPLCRAHHSEWHNKAATYMADTYYQAKIWLVFNGWHYCQTKKTWVPPSYSKREGTLKS